MSALEIHEERKKRILSHNRYARSSRSLSDHILSPIHRMKNGAKAITTLSLIEKLRKDIQGLNCLWLTQDMMNRKVYPNCTDYPNVYLELTAAYEKNGVIENMV